MRAISVAVLLLSVLFLVNGQTQDFYAHLTGNQEVPEVNTVYSGYSHLKYDNKTRLLQVKILHDIKSLIGALIFGPAPRGENADVIISFDVNVGEPNIPLVQNFTLDTEVEQEYLYDGLLYLNLETEQNPYGEIRGQIEEPGKNDDDDDNDGVVYVNVFGNSDGNGTYENPYPSLGAAAQASSSSNPLKEIIMFPGWYGGDENSISVSNDVILSSLEGLGSVILGNIDGLEKDCFTVTDGGSPLFNGMIVSGCNLRTFSNINKAVIHFNASQVINSLVYMTPGGFKDMSVNFTNSSFINTTFTFYPSQEKPNPTYFKIKECEFQNTDSTVEQFSVPWPITYAFENTTAVNTNWPFASVIFVAREEESPSRFYGGSIVGNYFKTSVVADLETPQTVVFENFTITTNRNFSAANMAVSKSAWNLNLVNESDLSFSNFSESTIAVYGPLTISHVNFDLPFGTSSLLLVDDNNSVLTSVITISDSTFSHGKAKQGAAIQLYDGNIQIDKCTFQDNFAMDIGGAIYCENGAAKVTNSKFYGNEAENGGNLGYCQVCTIHQEGNSVVLPNSTDIEGCDFF